MSGPLSPCPACRRHVLATEAACPFCAAPFGSDGLSIRSLPPGVVGLSRAAALAIGVTMVAACKDADPAFQPNNPAGAPVAVYGAPAPPMSGSADQPKPVPVPKPAPTSTQTQTETPSAPAYGGPPPAPPTPTTTSTQTTQPPTPAPMYGMPPGKR